MKNLIFLLLTWFLYPVLAASQNDDILFYTRNNRPSEAQFKFKKYNELAADYNRESAEIRKDRGMSFLKSAGALAGATLFHLFVLNNVDKENDTFQMHFWVYWFDGAAVGVVVNEISDRKGEAKYALGIYERAQAELKMVK